jgi:hypothetical protein
MHHRLHNLFVAVSLSFCAAICLLWVESKLASDCWYRANSTSQFTVFSGAGELTVAFNHVPAGFGPSTPEVHFVHTRRHKSFGDQAIESLGRPTRIWDRFGFHFLYQVTGASWGGQMTLASIPLALIAFICLVPPLNWSVKHFRSIHERGTVPKNAETTT